MSSTYYQLRQELYTLCPWLLSARGTTDSVATTSITDADVLRNTGLEVSTFHTQTIFRYAAANDGDREREAGDLTNTTGQLAHRGPNYVGTGAIQEGYEIVGKVTPTTLFNLYVVALQQRLKARVDHVLSRVDDGDMEATGVGSWAATNCTRAKTQAAASVDSGAQGLVVTNTAAGGYVQSTSVPVQPGRWLFASAAGRPESGTAQCVLYDVTNGAVLSDLRSSYPFWVVFQHRVTVPAGCYQVALRLGAVEATAVTDWDRVGGPWQEQDQVMNAPAWLDATSKLRRVRVATYTALASQGLYASASRSLTDYAVPQAVELVVNYADANPYKIQLDGPPPQDDLFLATLRPAYDLTKRSGAFVAPSNDAAGENTTVDLPPRLVAAAWAIEVCEWVLGATQGTDLDARTSLTKAREIFDSYVSQEPLEPALRVPRVSPLFRGV